MPRGRRARRPRAGPLRAGDPRARPATHLSDDLRVRLVRPRRQPRPRSRGAPAALRPPRARRPARPRPRVALLGRGGVVATGPRRVDEPCRSRSTSRSGEPGRTAPSTRSALGRWRSIRSRSASRWRSRPRCDAATRFWDETYLLVMTMYTANHIELMLSVAGFEDIELARIGPRKFRLRTRRQWCSSPGSRPRVGRVRNRFDSPHHLGYTRCRRGARWTSACLRSAAT